MDVDTDFGDEEGDELYQDQSWHVTPGLSVFTFFLYCTRYSSSPVDVVGGRWELPVCFKMYCIRIIMQINFSVPGSRTVCSLLAGEGAGVRKNFLAPATKFQTKIGHETLYVLQQYEYMRSGFGLNFEG
jgi:hypothetical protein